MKTVAAMAAFLALAGPPFALGDLESHLERSAEAEFSGEQVVTCMTPDGARESVVEVSQREGTVTLWSETTGTVMSATQAGLTVSDPGSPTERVTVGHATESEMAAYVVSETQPEAFLDRPAETVTVERDGVERLRLTIDEETGAVVQSVVLDGDGEVFCDRRFVSFEEVSLAPADLASPLAGEALDPAQVSSDHLPGEVAGLVRLDSYQTDDGLLSYYSDGFFSFGVVETDRAIDFDDEDGVVTVDTDGGAYHRRYEAGRVTVVWESGSGAIALIGDLPPDLTEEVMAALPQPSSPGLLERLWHRLFGP